MRTRRFRRTRKIGRRRAGDQWRIKAIYGPHTETLTLELKPSPVAESDVDKPGVILDYDADGNLVGLEILDASRRVAEARSMEFQVPG